MNIYNTMRNYKNYIRHDGEVGIEIETETKRAYDPPLMKFWSHHTDGSLRNFGIEYILRSPIKVNTELPEALEEFKQSTSKIKFIPDSHSTSVHVHMNMLNEKFSTLAKFLTTYTLVENILIRYSGPDRLSNLFCLPICDAEETYKNIIYMLQGAINKEYKRMFFSENSVKYGALNLAPFGTLGSIEIRTFRGETDVELIHDWVKILYSILEYSRDSARTPHTILDDCRKKEAKILDDIFQNNRKKISYNDEFQLIDKNLFYAAAIAYSQKDWTKIDPEEKPKRKLSSKELNAYSKSVLKKEFSTLSPGEIDYLYKYIAKNHSDYVIPLDISTWLTGNPAGEISLENTFVQNIENNV